MMAQPFAPKPSSAQIFMSEDAGFMDPQNDPASQTEIVIDKDLCINFIHHYVRCKNGRVRLTSVENQVMLVLYRHRGRIVPTKLILTNVWARSAKGSLQTLRIHIYHLRNKIEPDPDHPRYLLTAPGQGYCLSPAFPHSG